MSKTFDINKPDRMTAYLDHAADGTVLKESTSKEGRKSVYINNKDGSRDDIIILSKDGKTPIKQIYMADDRNTGLFTAPEGTNINKALTAYSEANQRKDPELKPIIKPSSNSSGDPVVKLHLEKTKFFTADKKPIEPTDIQTPCSFDKYAIQIYKYSVTPAHGKTPYLVLKKAYLAADQSTIGKCTSKTDNVNLDTSDEDEEPPAKKTKTASSAVA